MIRRLVGRVAFVLQDFATSTRHPTRTVETAFAWILFMWSYSVVFHTDMISPLAGWGSVYRPMIEVMPAYLWGWLGMVISVIRIFALIANGYFAPSPELRLLGAAWSLTFWLALTYCYFIAVEGGAPDFPFRRAYPVFIFFEAYSCYRCGIDIGKREYLTHLRRRHPHPAMRASHDG